MEWVSAITATESSLAANTTGAVYIVLPSVTRSYTDATLVRVRGEFRCKAAASSGGLVVGAVGVIAWDDIDDTPPPVGERPSPYIDMDLDWLWWKPIFFPALPAGTEVATMISKPQDFIIDSRAMRRLGNRKGILLTVTNSPTSAQAFSYLWGARCLLKE